MVSQNCLTDGYPATIAPSLSIFLLNRSMGMLPASSAVNGTLMHSITASAEIVP